MDIVLKLKEAQKKTREWALGREDFKWRESVTENKEIENCANVYVDNVRITKDVNDVRKEKIKELRKQKWSWKAIGVYFGISKARAHQISSGYNSHNRYKSIILNRDNFQCKWQEKCKGKFDKEDLVIHHIDFDDNNNNLKNLITLCRSCHYFFHHKYHVNRDIEKILQTGHQWNTHLQKSQCLFCKKEFDLSPFWAKSFRFCDKDCKKKYMDRKFTRQCNYCKKEFIVSKNARLNYYRNHEKFNKKSYCSRKCFALFQKGIAYKNA